MSQNSLRVRIVACAAGLAHLGSIPLPAADQTTKPTAKPASTTSTSVSSPAAAKPSLGTDVALADGKLTGRLLTANGQPIDGAVVTVLKDGKEVGKAVTTSDGSYAISDLKTGVHTIQTANGQQQIRLWSKELAPASAKSQLTISQMAVRGQSESGGLPEGGVGGGGGGGGGGLGGGGLGGGGGFGGFGGGGFGGLGGLGGGLGGLTGASMSTLLMGGVAVGAASFGAVQMNQNQKLQNQVDQLQDQIDQLQSP